jgi:hypothetical protein
MSAIDEVLPCSGELFAIDLDMLQLVLAQIETSTDSAGYSIEATALGVMNLLLFRAHLFDCAADVLIRTCGGKARLCMLEEEGLLDEVGAFETKDAQA